jgi:tetratricopeptide (TPR) repeat protein
MDRPNTTTATDYFRQGNEKFALEDYEGALNALDSAITLDPTLHRAYLKRGIVKHKIYKNYLAAIKDYDQAIILKPNYPKAYLYRAAAKHKGLNDQRGAIEDYDALIQLSPENACDYYCASPSW